MSVEKFSDLPNKSLLVWSEVAAFLRISKASVYRLREEGKIEAAPVRGNLRFFRESVITYVKKQQKQI